MTLSRPGHDEVVLANEAEIAADDKGWRQPRALAI
jgi:hypothetical protein